MGLSYKTVLCTIAATVSAFAQAPSSSPLSLNGSLLADTRVHVRGAQGFSWQEYRLDLSGSAVLPGRSRFAADLWLRYLGFPQVKHLDDLYSKDRLSPWNIDLREAYFDVYALAGNHLDLRIGRQRFAWGTADRINPTDNLNPLDLEDIWDFGRRQGADAVKATVYLGGISIQAGIVPVFKPAVLPRSEMAQSLFSINPKIIPGIAVSDTMDTVTMPLASPSQSTQAGLRVTAKLFDWDLSASYAYVRDDLPVARTVTITALDFSNFIGAVAADAKIRAELYYPRLQIAGLDCAGAIGDVGVRAEGALFFPEKTDISVALSDSLAQGAIGMFVAQSGMLPAPAAVLDGPYFKFVVGADYTFKNNIYLNGQFVHGFLHERGDSLFDYLIVDASWTGFDDRLIIKPANAAIEIHDWSSIDDSYAVVWLPEIGWRPVDNTELSLGAHIIEGTSGSTFGKADDQDEVYVRMKYSF
jgi:hypothetical protein